MSPFDAAWSVLKEDIQLTPETRDYIGEGSFRSTYAHPNNPNEVVKVGNRSGFNMSNIAAMNALAQLGYPVVPETPVMSTWQGTEAHEPRPEIAVTQPRAIETLRDVQKNPELSPTEKEEMAEVFRQEVYFPMSVDGPIRDPLMRAIGIRDVRDANTGIYHDGMKTIDFETDLEAHREPTYDGWGSWYATMPDFPSWLHVPPEQRRAFINLYSDRSLFEPWNDARRAGQLPSLSIPERYHWAGVRNLQLLNDMIDNPEQMRLFEFVDDKVQGDEALNRFHWGPQRGAEYWRSMIMGDGS